MDSSLRLVTNGVPQRSILDLTLCNIFISNLDDETQHTLNKFADDAKLGGVVDLSVGYAVIQRDFHRLEK